MTAGYSNKSINFELAIQRYMQISNFNVNDPQDPTKGMEFLDCVSKNYHLKTEPA